MRRRDLFDALSRTALLVRRDVFPMLDAEEVVAHLAARRVRVRADARNLAEPAGQAAITATVVAIAQLGARLSLDLPELPQVGRQPPLTPGMPLRAALLDLCADLLQPADVALRDSVDVTVLIGDTPADASDTVHGGVVLRVHGTAWEGALDVGPGALGRPWSGAVPFGPLLASQVAAAEVFRVAMADLAATIGVEPLAEHRIGSPEPVRLVLEPFDLSAAIDVGNVDAVSGGAITNGALAALLRVPGLSGHLRIIDDDAGGVSNLNRYALLRRSVLGGPKVHVLAALSTDDLRITPVARRLTVETIDTLLPLAPRVLVGVDDIPSRWLTQQHAPGWVCVGATSRMEIVVSEHQPKGPCAGCLHPYDDDMPGEIPTISFVSQLAGVLQAYRLLCHATTGRAMQPVVAYGLGLSGSHPLFEMGQVGRSDCPVGCSASRTAA